MIVLIALEKVSALDVQAGTNKLAQRYAASSVRRSVAKRLGHADQATTLRLYSHVLADQQPELAAAIGCALDGTAIATRK